MINRGLFRFAGSKRWAVDLACEVARECLLITGGIKPWVTEPFVGSGACSIALAERRLCSGGELIDASPYVAWAWGGLLMDPRATAEALFNDPPLDEDAYLESRASIVAYVRDKADHGENAPCSHAAAGIAAQLIQLIESAWHGLLRVNQDGDFNTPFGHDLRRVDWVRVRGIGDTMSARGFTSRLGDGCGVTRRHGDLVIADPPYLGGGHVAYTRRRWSRRDTLMVAAGMRESTDHGAVVLGFDSAAAAGVYRDERLDVTYVAERRGIARGVVGASDSDASCVVVSGGIDPGVIRAWFSRETR